MKSIKYIVATLCMACTLIAVAQDKVKVLIVNKLDGTKIEVPLSEIESVDVAEMDPFNGHEYVDLGLPSGTLWATCNVGANSPEEYGEYYAWGESITKSDYTWNTYLAGLGGTMSNENDCGTSKDPLVNNVNPNKVSIAGTMYDAAYVIWG